MTAEPETVAGAPAEPEVTEQGAGDGWTTAKNGRQFVHKPGGGWPVWRRGDETIEQALARAAKGGADKPPRSRRRREGRAKGADHPSLSKDELTRRIEVMLTDILCAPSYVTAMFGDEWGSNHFDTQGAAFAGNIARSSEHNPWLRGKLEAALEGEQSAVAIITSVSLLAGMIGYVAPPAIHYLSLPVSERTRALFGVPPDEPDPQPAQRQPLRGVGGPVPVTDAVPNMMRMAQAMADQIGTDQATEQALNGYPDASDAGDTLAGDAPAQA